MDPGTIVGALDQARAHIAESRRRIARGAVHVDVAVTRIVRGDASIDLTIDRIARHRVRRSRFRG